MSSVLRWSAVLLAWTATGALGIADALALRHGVLLVAAAVGATSPIARLIDQIVVFAVMLGWLVLVVYSQQRYFDAAKLRVLMARLWRITLVQLLALGSVGVVAFAALYLR